MSLHCVVYLTRLAVLLLFFFFNDTATTEIYTLSLHDALPVAGSRAVFVELEHRGQELLVVEAPVGRHGQSLEQFEDQTIRGIVLELVAMPFGHALEYTFTAPRFRTPARDRPRSGHRRGA